MVRTQIHDEQVLAFVPHPLPPRDPPLEFGAELAGRLSEAETALARLDLAGEMVPAVDGFLYAFVRKEAVLTSQIEGTQATLIDLLEFEAESGGEVDPTDPNIEEICNYVDALAFARKQLAADRGLPLSMRLLNESHKLLMRGVRGADKMPGEVRRSQNWIGGSRPGNAAFVPPPPARLGAALSRLEKFIHRKDSLPPLVRVGLVHVQFETIHPYLDGNGRMGRLLIALLLEHWKLQNQPVLYLSLFFRRHRSEYYRRLAAVRTDGDWEGWLDYFLDGVATIATEAVHSARDLFALVARDRARLLDAVSTSVTVLRLFELLPSNPMVTVSLAMKLTSTSKPTAGRAVQTLAELGILVETTGKKRDRSWVYQKYLDLLRVGTDDPPRTG